MSARSTANENNHDRKLHNESEEKEKNKSLHEVPREIGLAIKYSQGRRFNRCATYDKRRHPSRNFIFHLNLAENTQNSMYRLKRDPLGKNNQEDLFFSIQMMNSR